MIDQRHFGLTGIVYPADTFFFTIEGFVFEVGIEPTPTRQVTISVRLTDTNTLPVRLTDTRTLAVRLTNGGTA